MRKNGKTNAVGRGGALFRPAGYTDYRKSSANPYALTRLAVEADAHIGPAECTVFTGIYGEFVTSQWADRVVGPYNNPSHSL